MLFTPVPFQEISYNSTLKQQAVPQTPGPTTSSATYQTIAGVGTVAVSSSGGQRLSPLPGHKGIKKLTSFRNRSPTGQSPINKTRKSSQTIETLVSPKTKTWKGRVAKQLRRMHGQTGSPSSPTTQLPPEGATFKVPLELCPSVILSLTCTANVLDICLCQFLIGYLPSLCVVVIFGIRAIDRGNVHEYRGS